MIKKIIDKITSIIPQRYSAIGAAIALTLLANNVIAQNNGMSMRVRGEAMSNFEGADTYRTIVGASLNPTNYTNATPPFAQFGEFFRMYDDVGVSNGKTIHDTKVGLRVPKFNTGEAVHQVFIVGAIGDTKEGLGIETVSKINNLEICLTAENNSVANHTRKGFDLGYDFGKFELDLGFDQSDKHGATTEQPYGKFTWKPNQQNMLCLAAIKTTTGDKTAYKVGLCGIRYGEGTVGGRLYQDASWDDKGNEGFTGQLILAEDATFRRGGMDTMNDRRPSRNGAYGNTLEPIGPSPVSEVEGGVPNNMFPLYDRSDRGLAGLLSWKLEHSPTRDTRTLGAGIGYTLPGEFDGWRISFACIGNFTSDSVKGKSTSVIPTIRAAKYGRGHSTEVYLGAIVDPDGKIANKFALGLQIGGL